jgi:hypothetical protein
MALMQKIENFECALVNEQEQIPHKLLEEKYFVRFKHKFEMNFGSFDKESITKTFKNELEGMRELTVELFNNFLYVKECEPWLTKEGFGRIFSLFGRNSQGIGTSPFSVYVENVEKLRNITKLEKKKVNKFIDKIYSKLDKSKICFNFIVIQLQFD